MLEYLAQFKSASTLSIIYLEFVVYDQKNTDEELHTRLAILYIEDLLKEVPSTQEKSREVWENPSPKLQEVGKKKKN